MPRAVPEWIPSEANISDWPTREDEWHLISADAVWIEVVLPVESSFPAEWRLWAATVYNGASAPPS